MSSPFDLRNDLAVRAAKALDAKIEAAIRSAFDAGKDFALSQDVTCDGGDYFNPRPLSEPIVYTTSYRAGPIEPGAELPPRYIRYHRPKDWRVGQSLR